MNERVTTCLEEVDEDDLIEGAACDAEDIDEDLRRWEPEDYVVAIVGHRGSGKTALMARCLLYGLAQGIPVYTNLELHPEKCGLDKGHQALTLEHLLTFDQTLNKAIIGIDELGTWIERMRAMSTTNILLSKFFQLFIRKRGLRIFFTNQSPRLAAAIAEQVDLMIEGYDMFYSDWGREAGLAKGTSFLYTATDISGIFTGRPGTSWRWGLRKAYRLWPLFDSYQMFDPYQWARRTRLIGGETIVDLDTGEIYGADEEPMRIAQSEIKQYNLFLSKLYRDWARTGFLETARQFQAVLHESPAHLTLSVDRLRNAITRLTGKKRKQFEQDYNELRSIASLGKVAKFSMGLDVIEIAKPIGEETA